MVYHASIQKNKPCSSCPWAIDSDRTCCFEPKTLEKTVVAAMKEGKIHPCHSSPEHMCAGYLSFADGRLPQGAVELQMVRIAARLKLLDLDRIDPTIKVFKTVKAMLQDHSRRLNSRFLIRR